MTDLATTKAAQVWCSKETENIEFDVRLAKAFTRILDDYIEALRWCGGSADFQEGGKARKGWERIVKPLI